MRPVAWTRRSCAECHRSRSRRRVRCCSSPRRTAIRSRGNCGRTGKRANLRLTRGRRCPRAGGRCCGGWTRTMCRTQTWRCSTRTRAPVFSVLVSASSATRSRMHWRPQTPRHGRKRGYRNSPRSRMTSPARSRSSYSTVFRSMRTGICWPVQPVWWRWTSARAASRSEASAI